MPDSPIGGRVLEGVRLMAVGMTTVFAFLTLLVLAMQALRVVGSWFPDREPEASPNRAQTPHSDDHDIAVILAAIAATRGGR